ncbi:MAG TPA: hypothetical protein VK524_04190, partial [Polyangiaceae bacterium]|nr:hypothetical protein [Polyangiaceae bacterium]
MTEESDPRATHAAPSDSVTEPSEEEAERAAAQFRAAWQTQPVPAFRSPAPPAAQEPASAAAASALPPEAASQNGPGPEISAHPIVQIAGDPAAAPPAPP